MSEVFKKLNLMIPGPMPLHPEVQLAYCKPIISHRSSEFGEIYGEAMKLGKQVFKTRNDVFIMSSSGTGALESAVANLLNVDDKVIAANNGLFGEHMADIIRSYGIDPIIVKEDYGKPITPEGITAVLKKNPDVKAVFVIHNETSAGVTSDLESIAGEIRRINRDILIIVDAVSSLGGVNIETDNWDLDVVVSSSQKALAAPPGLSLISISDRAWKVSEKSKMTKYYFDWHRLKPESLRNMPFTTPPVHIVFALRRALQLLLEEGLDNVFNRNKAMRDMIIDAIEPLGLRLVPERKYASPTCTALRLPQGISSIKFRDHVFNKYSVLLGPGLGDISSDTFRIGHMGYIFPNDILLTLRVLELALKDFGYGVNRRPV